MGLDAICCPQHPTERDKLEEILKQKERRTLEEGTAFYIITSHTLYINKLWAINCV